jgi:hypothetical protein
MIIFKIYKAKKINSQVSYKSINQLFQSYNKS